MNKLRSLLLTVALALPLVSIGASGEFAGAVKPTGATGIVSEPEAQTQCCWVYYFGRWYCFECEL